jgi:hypothetical protein
MKKGFSDLFINHRRERERRILKRKEITNIMRMSKEQYISSSSFSVEGIERRCRLLRKKKKEKIG